MNSDALQLTDSPEPMAPSAKCDLKSLVLPQDFTQMADTMVEVATVLIRKPGGQPWFCASPDTAARITVPVIELQETRESYVVAPDLRDALAGEWNAKLLVMCAYRVGGIFLWPIRLPGPDGRHDNWNASALAILKKFAGQWIRLRSNPTLGIYEAVTTTTVIDPPTWPEPTPVFEAALHGRVIDSLEHPVVKKLRGEA